MAVLKLVNLHGAVVAVLPPEVLRELRLSGGDPVAVSPVPSAPDATETGRQIALAREIMRERHAVLREPAR